MNKVPQLGGLKQQECNLSQVWKLEVLTPDCQRGHVLPEGSRKESLLASPWLHTAVFPAGPSVSVCLSLPPMSLMKTPVIRCRARPHLN